MQEVFESAKYHTSNFFLIGYTGIYCSIDDRPLDEIIDSSTDKVFKGLQTSCIFLFRWLTRGSIKRIYHILSDFLGDYICYYCGHIQFFTASVTRYIFGDEIYPQYRVSTQVIFQQCETMYTYQYQPIHLSADIYDRCIITAFRSTYFLMTL